MHAVVKVAQTIFERTEELEPGCTADIALRADATMDAARAPSISGLGTLTNELTHSGYRR